MKLFKKKCETIKARNRRIKDILLYWYFVCENRAKIKSNQSINLDLEIVEVDEITTKINEKIDTDIHRHVLDSFSDDNISSNSRKKSLYKILLNKSL